jgi:lipoprotein-releasing system permease protein
LARTTALVAIVGIATGVGALIVALALANGFRDEIQGKILRGTAHLTVMRRDNQPIQNWPEVKSQVAAVRGVTDAGASSYSGVLVTTANGAVDYAVLRGLDARSPASVGSLRSVLTNGAIDSLMSPNNDVICSPSLDQCPVSPAVVGQELARRLNLHLGDRIQLTGGAERMTPMGSAPRLQTVQIVGIFRTGLYEYDATWIYVSLATVAAINNTDAIRPSVISVQTDNLDGATAIAQNIRTALGPDYTTVDWQQANGPLFAALALERRAGAVIIALIILIAALNITTMLILVVVERRTDIAILGAMGARASSIMLIFVCEGIFIGLVGATAGVVLGLIGCRLGDRFHLVSLPPDVYSISSVPFHPHSLDVIVAAALAFVLTLLSTLYPARAAARVRPVEILRDGG